MFNTIVNGLVHNAMDSETYVVNSNASLSSVLKSGVFASPASDFTTFQIGSTMVNSLRVSEINTLWMLQSVFIAKLSGVWYGGTPICDIKLYTSAVACIDGTAYFFMIAGDETPGGDHQWPAVRGADQLGTYGLNLTYIATTSEWSQNKYGFAANFTSDLRSTITNTLALQGQVAPDNDWFTLPECDLDYLNKTYNTEKYSGGGVPLWPYQNTLDNLAGGCADEVSSRPTLQPVRTQCTFLHILTLI
ncbi:hypothetical protein N7474_010292 [Penicillium riverlandense]|uniref:uncharacterized protein n=1 Tax=Penicillium riverlandense TaxID=1903569 RepID=UPI00254821D4|nr:uncharacterized protein N7474_010292 [Penicillium riverlandense]KAJ5806700.1 hypothetical protein N7474_010292 [Penicillium riverlandense]